MDLQQLANKAIFLFQQAPEIAAIYAFGSYAIGHTDRYSDVDLTLVSTNPAKTSRNLVKNLSKIHEVSYIFVLFEAEFEAAYTVFFKGLGMFKKLDIGITPSSVPNLFEDTMPVYLYPEPMPFVASPIVHTSFSQVEHDLVDLFIGASRFIKYINREKPWLAYKFFDSFRDVYLKDRFRFPTEEKLDLEKYKIVGDANEVLTDLIFVENARMMAQVYSKHLKRYTTQFSDTISQGAETLILETLELFKPYDNPSPHVRPARSGQNDIGQTDRS